MANKKPCRLSGKIKFDSHEIALTRAGEILERENASKEKTLRTYRCEFCNHWHITSQINFSKKQKKTFNLFERKRLNMVNKYS